MREDRIEVPVRREGQDQTLDDAEGRKEARVGKPCNTTNSMNNYHQIIIFNDNKYNDKRENHFNICNLRS